VLALPRSCVKHENLLQNMWAPRLLSDAAHMGGCIRLPHLAGVRKTLQVATLPASQPRIMSEPGSAASAAHLVASELVNEHAAVQLLDDTRVLPDDLPEVRHHCRRLHHILHPQPWVQTLPIRLATPHW